MATAQDQALCEKCKGKLVAGSRFCSLCGAPTPASHPFEITEEGAAPIKAGDVLEGKWRVEKKIGQGGMGSVYRCVDVALDRPVAVKVLAADLCRDEVFVARFEREARLTAGLEQPNVVLIYAVGRHLGRPFIVMKWLGGETLSRRLEGYHKRGTRMPVDEVRSVVRQVCAGLSYIHGKNLVHRDIKASNIVIDGSGHATILDFGILRDLKSKETLTAVGMLIGTPHYVSPEQILGKPFDARSDLYAVGVLLYEMLTGETPFDAENEFELVKKHVKEAPPDPCARNPALPPEVGEVLQRAIAKDPAKRFQTADELVEAFELAFAEPTTGPKIRDTDELQVLPAEKPEPPDWPTIPIGIQAEARPPAQKRALWIGVGLGVLASAATAVVVLSVGPEAPHQPPPAVPIAPPKPAVRQPKPAPKPVVTATTQDEEDDYEEDDAGIAAGNEANGPSAGSGSPSERPNLIKDAVEKDRSKLNKIAR